LATCIIWNLDLGIGYNKTLATNAGSQNKKDKKKNCEASQKIGLKCGNSDKGIISFHLITTFLAPECPDSANNYIRKDVNKWLLDYTFLHMFLKYITFDIIPRFVITVPV
jgi:hypothetical protein